MIDPAVFNVRLDAQVDDLPFASELSRYGDYVYVAKEYVPCGADVVIWGLCDDGRCERFTYATGPIYWKFDSSITFPDITDRDTASRFAAIESRMLPLVGPLNEKIQKEAQALIHDRIEVPREEAERASQVAVQIGDGCGGLLGVGSCERVIARLDGQVVDANTWDGNGDPHDAWEVFDQLFRLAGVLDPPEQRISFGLADCGTD